jgi:UDP-N-acetylglucosamine 4,6-dehydratase
LNKIEILITGGTGSLGKALIDQLKHRQDVRGIRIYSRDELKQNNMRQSLKDYPIPIAYIIGDIRDYERLKEAMNGVNQVIHTAALKQVPTAEENPIEFVRTNVYGTENVMRACVYNNVDKAILISTDKASEPINLYGATKLCAEKIWLKGGIYSGNKGTRFVAVRYGNVIGSRGSIVDLIKNLEKGKKIPITDPTMTRFWIQLPKVAKFILNVISKNVISGQVFIPKMISCPLGIFIEIMTGTQSNDWEIVGIRNGEKIHEQLINREEVSRTIECEDHYVVWPYKAAIHCKSLSKEIYSDERNRFYTEKSYIINRIIDET